MECRALALLGALCPNPMRSSVSEHSKSTSNSLGPFLWEVQKYTYWTLPIDCGNRPVGCAGRQCVSLYFHNILIGYVLALLSILIQFSHFWISYGCCGDALSIFKRSWLFTTQGMQTQYSSFLITINIIFRACFHACVILPDHNARSQQTTLSNPLAHLL